MQIGNLHLNNRFFLAPLAGISNLPFRLLNKEFGCALVYTEMISAQGLTRRGEKTHKILLSDAREKPVSYQIFGSDIEALTQSARYLQDYGADIIDINMGCPVRKVLRSGSGCALLAEPEKVRKLLESVRKAIDIPLTIKIRLGMQSDTAAYLKTAEIAEGEGVDAICMHPRTKNQQFKGEIDIDALRRLKESVAIPVIGSGNLFTVDDVRRMFDETGCDAVMIARGTLGNPFIFTDLIRELSPGLPIPEAGGLSRGAVIRRHVQYFLEHADEAVCHREMKKHMVWYTKGCKNSSAFRGKVVHTKNLKEMMTLVDEFFAGV